MKTGLSFSDPLFAKSGNSNSGFFNNKKIWGWGKFAEIEDQEDLINCSL
jgi:hypothetical protein